MLPNLVAEARADAIGRSGAFSFCVSPICTCVNLLFCFVLVFGCPYKTGIRLRWAGQCIEHWTTDLKACCLEQYNSCTKSCIHHIAEHCTSCYIEHCSGHCVEHWHKAVVGMSLPQTSGIPLTEYRKDCPPGWGPGDSDYPLKLYFERLGMWYRLYDGADETVGPLIAGRLVGRAQTIALQLRLPDPHGNVDVGDAALVRLAVDEVRDPMNPNIILQQHIPSGVSALCRALRDAFGEADQLQVTKSLEEFFDCRRGRLSLQEFSVEWSMKLDQAILHAGLQLNAVARTFLFFRAAQLPQKHVDDIMMQLQGDMNRFDEARALALRLAHRDRKSVV